MYSTHAAPIVIGGLKNIFYFGKDMGGNSLWRCIFLGGFLSEIMKEAYMKYSIVMDWLHHGLLSKVSGSNI